MRPHHAFWPRRLPESISVPETSLWDNLAVNARRYPDKSALVFFGTRVSYRQLAEGAERLSAQLSALGVQRGHRVVLCMQNFEPLARHVGVDGGGGNVRMPQQHLHRPQISAMVK